MSQRGQRASFNISQTWVVHFCSGGGLLGKAFGVSAAMSAKRASFNISE